MTTSDVPPRRAAGARVLRLVQEPGDDLSATTSPEQRLAIVDVLSRRMWEIGGRPMPSYTRLEMPVQVRRLR